MKSIQNSTSNKPPGVPSLLFCAVLLIFFGLNQVINFLRPITNLYVIYFDINLAEFQFLEFFDIINIIFGLLVIILGFLLFYYQEFNRSLLIFGGILFVFYNITNPTHIIIFFGLFSVISGAPPVWMSVIPENLLGIYISSWSILSLSNVLLQIIGFYLAIRIILNQNPKRAIFQFSFFYCWVACVSGIILFLQSILIVSLTATWTSLSVPAYLLRVSTWISMFIAGIMGIGFIWNWLKDRVQKRHLKFGQISIISFALTLLLISYSDIAMKTVFSLVLNSLIAGVLVVFALKLPKLFKAELE